MKNPVCENTHQGVICLRDHLQPLMLRASRGSKMRNRTHKLTLQRAVELRARGVNEDPRDLADEYGLSLAYAYTVIRGESHRSRIAITLDDATFLRLHSAALDRGVNAEDLCGRLLLDAVRRL